MAKTDIIIPVDFIAKIQKNYENSGKIIGKMLDAAGREVVPIIKTTLSRKIGSVPPPNTKKLNRTPTGQLIQALGITPAKTTQKCGYNVKIGFAEPRTGTRYSNGLIANILEFGRRKFAVQPARKFINPNRIRSYRAAINKMQEIFDAEVNG